jgi:hypothetical protein
LKIGGDCKLPNKDDKRAAVLFQQSEGRNKREERLLTEIVLLLTVWMSGYLKPRRDAAEEP